MKAREGIQAHILKVLIEIVKVKLISTNRFCVPVIRGSHVI